ncbi:polyprenyl diphosphate synthase [Cardinium endosymbiont of Tipula unca]|uniref:polyprenyl diphosphate synthase n=1 Tax=Cardinium endosymbiont of Tipula unca TaxID=3066216 RepID=UPI0030D1562E
MEDKKTQSSFFLSFSHKRWFIIFLLQCVLVPAYTSFPDQSNLHALPTLQENPKHIGVIMDGNGRWGTREKGSRSYGHENARQAVDQLISGCLEQGIAYLTLYAFSSENWDRPKQEVETIFRLISKGIGDNLNGFIKHNIRFRVIGDTAGIPDFCWQKLKEVIEATKDNTALHLTVAINYGGRAEATAASEAMVNDFLIKAVDEFLGKGFDHNSCFGNFINFVHNYHAKITPTIYQKYLYTGDLPNVDLLIRTGGKKRLSNFCPWQCAYSELYFTDVLWPDFTKDHLMDALSFFQKETRNFGKVA